MTPRPLIFISAVSRELHSARQLVANTLTFLGYQPVWQDIFGTETGDLRSVLREKIDQCKGVVQLVGKCYGAEPPTADEEFGRVSYTQYEALYARKRGKKVWYLFIDEHFPADSFDAEPEQLRELQASYRQHLQTDTHVFHSLTSTEALEAGVLKLRDDLTRLRRGVKRWATGVAVLLILIAALVIWLVHGQGQAASEMGETKRQLAAMTAEMTKLRQGIMEYPRLEAKVRGSQTDKKREDVQEQVYAQLGKQLDIKPKILREKLPGFAEQLKRAPDASSYARANAAYVAKDYLEAERLSLQAADETRKAMRLTDTIKALKLAGLAAQKHIEYARAMEHFREAEKLTDRERNPKDWADVQHAIAALLKDQGHYGDAESILRNVVELRTYLLGAEHPDTLSSRSNLACARDDQGKHAEAEAEYRLILKLREKVLGPEHPDTLGSRDNLAGALLSQGEYAEAETQYRDVIELRERILGPENADTLNSRTGLAMVLSNQGKYQQAKAEIQTILEITEKVLGPEHPDTLFNRCLLANALNSEANYAEAEAQYRDALKILEKVVGPENPETLRIRSSLAETLGREGKYTQAAAQYRDVIKVQEKVIGPKSQDTLASRNNLAYTLELAGNYIEAEQEIRTALSTMNHSIDAPGLTTVSRDTLGEALRGQRKFAEAEMEFRTALTGLDRTGVENDVTFIVAFHLARCLKDENKLPEAKQFAQRAVEGARTQLGPNHPDAKEYEKLLLDLQAKR